METIRATGKSDTSKEQERCGGLTRGRRALVDEQGFIPRREWPAAGAMTVGKLDEIARWEGDFGPFARAIAYAAAGLSGSPPCPRYVLYSTRHKRAVLSAVWTRY